MFVKGDKIAFRNDKGLVRVGMFLYANKNKAGNEIAHIRLANRENTSIRADKLLRQTTEIVEEADMNVEELEQERRKKHAEFESEARRKRENAEVEDEYLRGPRRFTNER